MLKLSVVRLLLNVEQRAVSGETWGTLLDSASQEGLTEQVTFELDLEGWTEACQVDEVIAIYRARLLVRPNKC